MTSSKIKALLVENEIGFGEIAIALGIHYSTVSHTLAYQRCNPETRRRIEDYVRKRLNRPRLRLFDEKHAPARAPAAA